MLNSYYNSGTIHGEYDDMFNGRCWRTSLCVDASLQSGVSPSSTFATLKPHDIAEEPVMSRYSFGNADEAIIREVEMEKEKSEADSQSTEVTPTVLDNMDGDRNFSPEVNMSAVPGPMNLSLQPELDSINLHASSEPSISQAPVLPKQPTVLRPVIAIPSPSPSLNSEPSTLPPDSVLHLNGPVVSHLNPLPPLSIPLQPTIGMNLVPPASPVRDKNMPAIIHRTTSQADWEDSPREKETESGEVSMAPEREDAVMKSPEEYASDHTLKSPEQEYGSDHTLKSPGQSYASDHTLKSPEQEYGSDHTLKSPEQDLASDNTIRNSAQDDSVSALEKEGSSLPEEAAHMPSVSTLTNILHSNRHINSRLDPIAGSVDRLSLKAEYLQKKQSGKREMQKDSEEPKTSSQAQTSEVSLDNQVLSFDFGSKPRKPRPTLSERFARYGRKSEKKKDVSIVVVADEPSQPPAETHEETKTSEPPAGKKEEVSVLPVKTVPQEEVAPVSEEKSYAPHSQEFIFTGPSEEMKSGVFTDGSQMKEVAEEVALPEESSPSTGFEGMQQQPYDEVHPYEESHNPCEVLQLPYEEPQHPYEEPQLPYEEPQHPCEVLQLPYEEPQHPYEEPQLPYEEPQHPCEVLRLPYEEPQHPYEEPQLPYCMPQHSMEPTQLIQLAPQIGSSEQEERMRQQMITGVFTDSPLPGTPLKQKEEETPVLSDEPSQTLEPDEDKTQEDLYTHEPVKSNEPSQVSNDVPTHEDLSMRTSSPIQASDEHHLEESRPVDVSTASEAKQLPEKDLLPEPPKPQPQSERRMQDLDELQRGAGVVLPASVTRYLAQEEVKYTESELRREVLSAEHRGKEKGKQLVATIQVAMESLQAEKEALESHVAELESQMETVEAVRTRGTGGFEEEV